MNLNNVKDTVLICVGLLFALIALVLIALLGNGTVDAELAEAVSYAVVGLTGALGGAARKTGA